MSQTQYVRAGACVIGEEASLSKCALEAGDCPDGSTFLSAREVADDARTDAPAAECLKNDAVVQLLGVRCSDDHADTIKTGACFVGNDPDEDQDDVYQCAVSQDGCAAEDTYFNVGLVAQQGGVTCKLCLLPSSEEDDLSDVTFPYWDRLDDGKKLEAVGVAGIVIGVLVGCGLLICMQRMCRRCCGGGRSRKDETFGKDSARTDAGENHNSPAWADTTTATAAEEENKVV